MTQEAVVQLMDMRLSMILFAAFATVRTILMRNIMCEGEVHEVFAT